MRSLIYCILQCGSKYKQSFFECCWQDAVCEVCFYERLTLLEIKGVLLSLARLQPWSYPSKLIFILSE